MATTKTQTFPIKGQTMTIDLKCVCGKVLSILCGPRNLQDVRAVAAASNWKVCEDYPQSFSPKLDGYCPQCHAPEPMPCPSHAP
jgi:hypothetical protein